MPQLDRGVLEEITAAAGRNQQDLDPLLPEPGVLPDGCAVPFVADGQDGRPGGIGVCHHQAVPAGTLAQTWGMAARFDLTPRLRDPGLLDQLLTQWRQHLAGLQEAEADDTAAVVTWPSRQASGVNALLRHGMQPIAVIAARPNGRATSVSEAPGVTIREAGPRDVEAVAEMEMGVIRYDAHFGGSVLRPATETLVREDAQARLACRPSWTWLAERDGRPAALIVVHSPQEAAWISGLTRPGPAAYLYAGFATPSERGSGAAAALVRHVHGYLDAEGVAVTLLHYAVANPLSGPFWNRMGYRPLWVSWEARPAAALR